MQNAKLCGPDGCMSILFLVLGLRDQDMLLHLRLAFWVGCSLLRVACCAGYEEQKQEIQDTLLLAMRQPEVYEVIAAGTRLRQGSNRPECCPVRGPPWLRQTDQCKVC